MSAWSFEYEDNSYGDCGCGSVDVYLELCTDKYKIELHDGYGEFHAYVYSAKSFRGSRYRKMIDYFKGDTLTATLGEVNRFLGKEY